MSRTIEISREVAEAIAHAVDVARAEERESCAKEAEAWARSLTAPAPGSAAYGNPLAVQNAICFAASLDASECIAAAIRARKP